MKLNEAIILYRAKNHISQKEFAEMCGVTPQTIYNVESVGQKPSKTTLVRMKLVLGNEYPVDEDGEQ